MKLLSLNFFVEQPGDKNAFDISPVASEEYCEAYITFSINI